ncbi:MAG: PilZ domain-containing protein [Desulfobacterales bacterium]
MVSSDKHDDQQAATKRMFDLVEKLSLEEQRILARLLNNWENRDQRSHPRIPCTIITEYQALNRSYKDTIKNISLNGAFIESTNRFPVNLEINQRFFFPNFEIPIRSLSKIAWTASSGFGVQFESVDRDNRQQKAAS